LHSGREIDDPGLALGLVGEDAVIHLDRLLIGLDGPEDLGHHLRVGPVDLDACGMAVVLALAAAHAADLADVRLDHLRGRDALDVHDLSISFRG